MYFSASYFKSHGVLVLYGYWNIAATFLIISRKAQRLDTVHYVWEDFTTMENIIPMPNAIKIKGTGRSCQK